MYLRKDFQCQICFKILKEPTFLPCKCTNICREHIDELIKKSRKKSHSHKCNKCHKKFKHDDMFIENLTFKHLMDTYCYLSDEELEIKMNLEKTLLQLETLILNLNQVIFQFSVTQYDHFLNMRRDIDVKREILIEQAFKRSITEGERQSILRDLNSKSENTLNKCNLIEMNFRQNFNRIKPKFVVFNIENEQNRMDILLRDPNLNLNSMQELQLKYERHIKQLKERLDLFELFHYDLNRNKFHTNFDDLKFDSFGRLDTFDEFINPLNEKILNLIASSFEREHPNVIVWNLNTNSSIKSLEGHTSGILCLILYGEEKLITGSRNPDNTIKIWNLRDGLCLKTLQGHAQSVCSIILLRKYEQLVSGSSDNTIKLWDLSTYECILTLNSHESTITCLAQFPNEFIVSGSMDCSIKVWDLTLNECLKTLFGHVDGVQCLKSLSNYMLATGSCDKTIKIWNCSSGECVRTLCGHTHFIQCLELTRYNELISCARDHTIRIWNLSEGKCIQIFDEHTDVVWCIRMDLNGEKLKRGSNGRFFSGSQDGTIKIWDLDSFECIQTINTNFPIFRLEFFKGVCKL